MLFSIAGLKTLSVGAALLPSVLWPVPKQAVSRPDLLLTSPAKITAPSTLSKPAGLLKRELAETFSPQNTPAKDATNIRLELSPSALIRPEEYTVEASGRAIIIKAHDEQGAFWGVHSLLQLVKSEQVKQIAKGYVVPGIKLHDWPDTPFRAFMIHAAWSGTPDDLKKNLDLLARMKVRYFALHLGSRVVLDYDPSIAVPENPSLRLSKKQARDIIDYGRSLGLEPIGYLNTLAHLDQAYQKPPYTDHGGIAIENPESYDKFVYPILSEMLEVYGPVKYFHCGMDEAAEMFRYYSEHNMDSAGLLTQHITKVNNYLAGRNVRMVIWHDMLLSPEMTSELGPSIGPANGGPPFNTAAALDKLPRSVILNYWNYDSSDTYPVIDYFKKLGFEVWSSPWYTPFGIVHYSAEKNVPTFGTIWADPPDCFTIAPYDIAAALYAQAAWHASKSVVGGEPTFRDQSRRATSDLLYGRTKLGLKSGSKVRLIRPGDAFHPTQTTWPTALVKITQSYGVPFDLSRPAAFDPMQLSGKPIESGSVPGYVDIPGGERLTLDGVNTSRGEDKLILYMAPISSTKTNNYGVEVSVSSTGEVTGVTDNSSSDAKVPDSGFVLSAHAGPDGVKAAKLLRLRPGDQVSVFDTQGTWIGGRQPILIWAELPSGEKLRVDRANGPRESGQLVMYEHGYRDSKTGTNAYGAEVAVKDGVVTSIQNGAGNIGIPSGGYVLSAHLSSPGYANTGLLSLKQGDKVRLLTNLGGTEQDLSEVLNRNRWESGINAYADRLFIISATKTSLPPGAIAGILEIRYADGALDETAVKYGLNVISENTPDVPSTASSNTWLMHPKTEAKMCVVYEWTNPRPKAKIETIRFQPNLPSLQSGFVVYGVTVVR